MQEASVTSAKFVKKSSYLPFLVLLTGFFGTTIYNRYEDRRLRDEEMIMNQWIKFHLSFIEAI